MKAVVYAGTRNLYHAMNRAARSLMRNSLVDRIWFLTEDDQFPERLPEMVETINVSGQTFFRPDGPNFRTRYTYMTLMRLALSKLLPETLDKVLYLDVDTVVLGSLDKLWDLDMTGKWFAAATEDKASYRPYGPEYYNAGVMMFNLGEIRKDHADDEMIQYINSHKLTYPDQDVMNKLGNGKFVRMPGRYNESVVTGWTNDPIVIHYAGTSDWYINPRCWRREYLDEYEDMTWEEVLRK